MLAGTDAGGAAAIARDLIESGRAERVEGWTVATRALEALRERAASAVAHHHDRRPLEPGVELAALASRLHVTIAQLRAALAGSPDVVVDRDVVRAVTHAARASDRPDGRRLLDALRGAPFSPPAPAEVGVDAAVGRVLVRDGDAVELHGVLFAAAALDDAAQLVAAAFEERDALSVADIRDLLGSTRKYVVPIVEHLDAIGVTRRRGDERIAGPRARLRPSDA
jgi:selenocysteine-specific elongation factor